MHEHFFIPIDFKEGVRMMQSHSRVGFLKVLTTPISKKCVNVPYIQDCNGFFQVKIIMN